MTGVLAKKTGTCGIIRVFQESSSDEGDLTPQPESWSEEDNF
jgi:hypothetical protein